MNRRNFFRNLVIGAASAPAIAKALAEEPVLTIEDFDCTNINFPDSLSMQHQIAQYIATHNPYSGLLFSTDQQPLRFSQ